MFQWSRSSKFLSGPASWHYSQDSLTQSRPSDLKVDQRYEVSERPTAITLGPGQCVFCFRHRHHVGTARVPVSHFISNFPTESCWLQLPLYCCARPIPAMWAETQKTYSFTLWRKDFAYTQDTWQCSQCFTSIYSTTFSLITMGCFNCEQQTCEFSLNMEHNTAEWAVYLVG